MVIDAHREATDAVRCTWRYSASGRNLLHHSRSRREGKDGGGICCFHHSLHCTTSTTRWNMETHTRRRGEVDNLASQTCLCSLMLMFLDMGARTLPDNEASWLTPTSCIWAWADSKMHPARYHDFKISKLASPNEPGLWLIWQSVKYPFYEAVGSDSDRSQTLSCHHCCLQTAFVSARLLSILVVWFFCLHDLNQDERERLNGRMQKKRFEQLTMTRKEPQKYRTFTIDRVFMYKDECCKNSRFYQPCVRSRP